MKTNWQKSGSLSTNSWPTKSFPGKFSDLNWSELDDDNIEEIEELYNEVMLTLDHAYQKLAGMVGVAYQTAM